MTKQRGTLAVDRMTDAALWQRLDQELVHLAAEFPRAWEPSSPAYAIRLARLCASELRLRGVQLQLHVVTGPPRKPHYMEGV
jgi:hypothetical protein